VRQVHGNIHILFPCKSRNKHPWNAPLTPASFIRCSLSGTLSYLQWFWSRNALHNILAWNTVISPLQWNIYPVSMWKLFQLPKVLSAWIDTRFINSLFSQWYSFILTMILKPKCITQHFSMKYCYFTTEIKYLSSKYVKTFQIPKVLSAIQNANHRSFSITILSIVKPKSIVQMHCKRSCYLAIERKYLSSKYVNAQRTGYTAPLVLIKTSVILLFELPFCKWWPIKHTTIVKAKFIIQMYWKRNCYLTLEIKYLDHKYVKVVSRY